MNRQRITSALLGGRAGLVVVVALGTGSGASPTVSNEAPFLVENQAAMDRMMAGMAVHPSGDVDQDFAAMMIPHHQGAIDMAKAELRYGHNEQLRRLAQEIIIDQQQEITVMYLATGKPLPSDLSSSVPSSVHPGSAKGDQR